MVEMTQAQMVQVLRAMHTRLSTLRQQAHAYCEVCDTDVFYALPDAQYQCILCGHVQSFPGEQVLSRPSQAFGDRN